mmetsp:Transcript_5817/g.20538  ORF Transcript_5817/g.20538 Transcript_5817/m.20538 type:complete len:105 (+) Transcript_5817:252-566(+)
MIAVFAHFQQMSHTSDDQTEDGNNSTKPYVGTQEKLQASMLCGMETLSQRLGGAPVSEWFRIGQREFLVYGTPCSSQRGTPQRLPTWRLEFQEIKRNIFSGGLK